MKNTNYNTVMFFGKGINRIWHTSENFQKGLKFKIRLWDQDLDKKDSQDFIELGEGLYYLDCDFNQRGAWIGIIYENGTKVTSVTFSVG